MSDAWVILLGTLFGGAGLKIVEFIISRNKDKESQSRQFRDELRDEIKSLRDQLALAKEEEARLEMEIETWRGRYYDLRDIYSKAQTELFIALEKIKVNGVEPRDEA